MRVSGHPFPPDHSPYSLTAALPRYYTTLRYTTQHDTAMGRVGLPLAQPSRQKSSNSCATIFSTSVVSTAVRSFASATSAARLTASANNNTQDRTNVHTSRKAAQRTRRGPSSEKLISANKFDGTHRRQTAAAAQQRCRPTPLTTATFRFESGVEGASPRFSAGASRWCTTAHGVLHL